MPTYTFSDGITRSMPTDLGNADYQRYLKETGRTHAEVVAEEEAARQASAAAQATKAANRQAALARAKTKLMAPTWSPLTQAEAQALLGED